MSKLESSAGWDGIVIGAGPAGLMAAIQGAAAGLRVLVLESQPKIGAKLLITGGGRCNVAPLKATEHDYHSGDTRTVRNVLRAFSVEKTRDFFRRQGVEFVLEEREKYFPREQSARVILDALFREVKSRGVCFETSRKVVNVSAEQDFFRVIGEDFERQSRSVLIATGGLSYPKTGSDGFGYELAKKTGHVILPTVPALTPLTTHDPDWKSLAGVTLPVVLSLAVNEKKLAQSTGAMLFTHAGFSGPAILDISGAWIRCKDPAKKLFANFLPQEKRTALQDALIKTVAHYPKRSLKRFLAGFFPDRLNEVLIRKSGSKPDIVLSQIPKADRDRFFENLFCFPLDVSGALGYDKAEITSGGVDLEEVNNKTLESKRVPGLFFAGEMLDVDGRIGGFNLQWAWASGFVAGTSMARKLKPA